MTKKSKKPKITPQMVTVDISNINQIIHSINSLRGSNMINGQDIYHLDHKTVILNALDLIVEIHRIKANSLSNNCDAAVAIAQHYNMFTLHSSTTDKILDNLGYILASGILLSFLLFCILPCVF